MTIVTLPHHRTDRYRGKKLVAIWLGLVIGSWLAAYAVLRVALWLFEGVAGWLLP